jgi:hypothetical protein
LYQRILKKGTERAFFFFFFFLYDFVYFFSTGSKKSCTSVGLLDPESGGLCFFVGWGWRHLAGRPRPQKREARELR